MADSFLDGTLSLDSFIDDYQSKRKLAHLRRVKIDKLQETVLKDVQVPQGSSNGSSQPQETSSSSTPFQGLSNGSPAHVKATPTSQPLPLSYPLPNMVPSYSCPFPPLPQGPGTGLPPRAGFIMQ